MTRLQNAQKQISDALATLESVVDHTLVSASSPQTYDKKNLDSDLSTLVEEVSVIEAKLCEAIGMIAIIGSVEKKDGDKE